MAWTIDDELNHKLLSDVEKVGPGEWQFRLGTLKTPIRVFAWREPDTERTHFSCSHAIHTPTQGGPYWTSRPSGDSPGHAIHSAISGLTMYYEGAVKLGHPPSEKWLVANKVYRGSGMARDW